MPRWSDIHVGRDAELGILDRCLEDTCAGRATMVFVGGEPGIGKTHLFTELARRAETPDCLVLEGAAAEFEHELPFGPLIDALDAYIRSLGPRVVARLAADGLADLAEVFPALRSLRSASEVPPAATERFRLYFAVRELLERLGAQQPLVLLLDDLHWADASSLELVAHLLRRPPDGPVLVAGSFRKGQVDAALVAAIDTAVETAGHGGSVRRIELGPLTADQASELMADADTTTRQRLYHQSGGNPFYLLQIARDAGRSSGGGRGGGADDSTWDGNDDLAAPPAVAAAIARELAVLSASARVVAQAASVVGDPFDLDLAVATAGVDEDLAVGALDELIGRDLIRPARVPRRFRFRHPLVRSAVYGSATTSVRLASHARCAAALEAQGSPAVARAFHVEQSARRGDRIAVELLIEAGTATARRLPSTSARWYEAALRLLPGRADPDERLELLTATAGALATAGRLAAARTVLLEGLDLVPVEARQRRVRLTTACAGIEQRLGRHQEAHDRLIAALDELTDRSSEDGVALMVALAADGFYRLEYEAMQRWATSAAAGAAPLHRPSSTAAAEAVLGLACSFTGSTAEAIGHCLIAARVIDTLSDDELSDQLDIIGHLVGAEVYLDRYEEAAVHSRRGIAVARVSGQDDVFPTLYPCLGVAMMVLGRLAEAAEVLETALEAARLTGNVQSIAWGLLNRALAALMTGDLELARRAAEESVELAEQLGENFITQLAQLIKGWVLLEDGDPGGAAALMVAAGGGDDLPRVGGGWRTTYLEVLVRCWLASGQQGKAGAAAASALDVALDIGLPRSTAMAQRAAAEVALHEGRSREAVELAVLSVSAAASSAAHLDAALSRVVSGRALARTGDVDRAVAELRRAAADLDTYGAVRYRDEAERELRRLGQRIHRRSRSGKVELGGVGALSGREMEIARLVVDRRTNPEIAGELFLSLKTVETHMRNIFRKLEVSSRVEVARAIERAEAS